MTGYVLQFPGNQHYQLCPPENTYLAGIHQVLDLVGIPDARFAEVEAPCISLGHLTILPDVEISQVVDNQTFGRGRYGVGHLRPNSRMVQKGQPLGNFGDSSYAFPMLAYQITFWYRNTFCMVSPTLFRHEVVYPINFSPPADPVHEKIYPNSEGPWLCDFDMQKYMGDHWRPWFCYPELFAYPH